MKKFTLIAGAALIAATGAAIAQPASAPGADRPASAPGADRPASAPGADRYADVTRQQMIERADQRFARLDTNGDGRATAEEARQVGTQRRVQRRSRMFDRLDVNRDGSITRAEFDSAHEARGQRAENGERRGRAMRGHRRHHGGEMRGARLFGEQGFITRDQMRERAETRFARLDLNRDGTLTAAERQQARQQRRQQRQERRGRPND